MLKNTIEKIENDLKELFLSAMNYDNVIDILEELLPNLKKEAELQEEMINLLIEYVERACYYCPDGFEYSIECKECGILNDIKTIEKYYNKSWEEIIKSNK